MKGARIHFLLQGWGIFFVLRDRSSCRLSASVSYVSKGSIFSMGGIAVVVEKSQKNLRKILGVVG